MACVFPYHYKVLPERGISPSSVIVRRYQAIIINPISAGVSSVRAHPSKARSLKKALELKQPFR